LDGSDAGTCRACGPGQFGEFAETRQLEGSTCKPCASGYYQGNDASPMCHACPTGWRQNNDSSPAEFKYCFTCLPGEYQDEAAQTTCKPCAANTESKLTGRSSACDSCGTGRSAGEGSTSCSDCLAGKHQQSVAGSSEKICAICSPGNYTDASNMDACKQCPLGYAQSSPGQTSCIPCVKGEYNDVKSAATCKLCEANTYSIDKNRTTECISCATGRFAAEKGSASCSDCLAGQFEETTSKEDKMCSSCSPGHYTDASNMPACKQCPRGYAQSSPGQTTCVECSPGEFNGDVGVAACELCAENTYYG
jgi:hypothetical protein